MNISLVNKVEENAVVLNKKNNPIIKAAKNNAWRKIADEISEEGFHAQLNVFERSILLLFFNCNIICIFIF